MRDHRKVFNLYKTIQAIHYLASRFNGQSPYMKILKLLYFADRYHLRNYGITITGDEYKAMKYGSLGSQTANVVKENEAYFLNLEQDDLEYARRYLELDGYDVRAKNACEYEEIAPSEREALDFVLTRFGEFSQFELADITHDYPEWKKLSESIQSGEVKVVDEDMVDFFSDPDLSESPFISKFLGGIDPFADDPEVVKEIRDFIVAAKSDP